MIGASRRFAGVASLAALSVAACATTGEPPATPLTVADTPTDARAPDGEYISWREHRIDDEDLAGVPIRGGDGLQMADIDRDGFLDIVSVHEDSNHLRIAFGSADPDPWVLTETSSARSRMSRSAISTATDGPIWCPPTRRRI